MAIDLQRLTLGELEQLIMNHRRKGATSAPLLLDAMRERERRKGRGLDFDTSFRVILAAARERRFISYKDLADASGADWSKVHYEVGGHLWRLVEYAYRRGWPMLSAVVVNKQNLGSGAMEPDTLKGFAGAARDLGYEFDSAERFLRDQQQQVFDWAVGHVVEQA